MYRHGSAEPGSIDANLDPGSDGEAANLGSGTSAKRFGEELTDKELHDLSSQTVTKLTSQIQGIRNQRERLGMDDRGETLPGASTSSELIHMVGEALYGSRYESDLADALGVNRRTARRWRTGDTAPGAGVWRDLLVLLHARAWHLEGLASEVRRRF